MVSPSALEQKTRTFTFSRVNWNNSARLTWLERFPATAQVLAVTGVPPRRWQDASLFLVAFSFLLRNPQLRPEEAGLRWRLSRVLALHWGFACHLAQHLSGAVSPSSQ